MPPTEGRVVVAGFDVFEQPIEAKRRTGYLPETPPLYPDMTVREYLTFVAQIKGVASGERKARVDAGDGAHVGRRHGGPPLRQALEGLPPARRPGAGAPAQSRRAGARRADGRPRSEADHRDPPAHQGTGRRSHDHPEHAHPARGRADLPARGHHQQGQGRRRRHAGQPHAAACAARRRCTCSSTAATPPASCRAWPASRAWPSPTGTARRWATRSRACAAKTSGAIWLARSCRRAGACSSCGRCA